MLYYVISPSMTCNNIYIIFGPTVIGVEIDPIVEHKELLNTFDWRDGVDICEKGRFIFLYATVQIIFMDNFYIMIIKSYYGFLICFDILQKGYKDFRIIYI